MNKVHWTAPQFMAINPKILQLMEQQVEKINKELSNFEEVKNSYFYMNPWNIESGELTPTLKLRRKFIQEKYSKEVELMYK